MKKIVVLIILMMSYSVHAQLRKHPIDVEHDKCIDKDSLGDGSPGPMRECDYQCLISWRAEMKRLLVKLPSEQAKQVNWEKRVKQATQAFHSNMKKDAGPEYSQSMSELDAIRWMETQAARRRVAVLNKMLKGKSFAVPTDEEACDIGAGYLPKFGL